jgi:hypothetical protein
MGGKSSGGAKLFAGSRKYFALRGNIVRHEAETRRLGIEVGRSSIRTRVFSTILRESEKTRSFSRTSQRLVSTLRTGG